jgi:hypothetical protein
MGYERNAEVQLQKCADPATETSRHSSCALAEAALPTSLADATEVGDESRLLPLGRDAGEGESRRGDAASQLLSAVLSGSSDVPDGVGEGVATYEERMRAQSDDGETAAAAALDEVLALAVAGGTGP